MTDNIKDKVIVITGASSGMGEAAAHHLAANGAKQQGMSLPGKFDQRFTIKAIAHPFRLR